MSQEYDERTDAEKSAKARIRYQKWFNMAFSGDGQDVNALGTKISSQDFTKIMKAAGIKPRRQKR